MSAIMTKTVGELAAENPAATRVFEKLGIDYCCGGSNTLEQACRAAGLPLETVRDSIEMDWRRAGPRRKAGTGELSLWPS